MRRGERLLARSEEWWLRCEGSQARLSRNTAALAFPVLPKTSLSEVSPFSTIKRMCSRAKSDGMKLISTGHSRMYGVDETRQHRRRLHTKSARHYSPAPKQSGACSVAQESLPPAARRPCRDASMFTLPLATGKLLREDTTALPTFLDTASGRSRFSHIIHTTQLSASTHVRCHIVVTVLRCTVQRSSNTLPCATVTTAICCMNPPLVQCGALWCPKAC